MGEHARSTPSPASSSVWVWRAAVAAAGLSTAFAAVLYTHPFGPSTLTAIDDLGALGAALLAGVGATTASIRAYRSGLRRFGLTWALVAAGASAWAMGEAIWSMYELVRQEPVPFPSAADAGFLAMPLLAGAGLMLWPASRTGRRDRLSALLDGVIIASALLLLSWSLTLGAAWQAGGSDTMTAVIGAAYPIGDVVLASLAVMLLSRAEPANRASLLLLTSGVLALAVADTAFLYGTANADYASGDVLDVGWFAGFLAIGVAGLATQPTLVPVGARSPTPGWPRLLLPYLPTAFAIVEVFFRLYTGRTLHPLQITCALVIFLAGLLRQFLALADNRRLLTAVRASEERLRHQALHDPLTGLANRALFADRVDHALRLAARDHLPRSVLFIDLDDFKLVNDGLGHAAGDRVLVDAAARLQACVRDSDTVARLGGDEFAILLEGHQDSPQYIADRIVRRLRHLVDMDGQPVPITASVGIATHHPDRDTTDPQRLLAAADQAMYAAKAAGKDRHSTMPTGDAPSVTA